MNLYSAGILLYELLCGATPFANLPPIAALRVHIDLVPGRPDGIPDDLWATIAVLLAKDPAARPPAGETANA